VNHEAARLAAALVAYPNSDPSGSWAPTPMRVQVIAPVKEPRWSLEQCADVLDAEPSGVEDWRPLAPCKGLDPNWFFPERGPSVNDMALIRRLCSGCQVRVECLAFALNNNEDRGWWGGLSDRERRSLRTKRSMRERGMIVHGTRSGYDTHLRVGEDPCGPCTQANRARERAQARAAREEAS